MGIKHFFLKAKILLLMFIAGLFTLPALAQNKATLQMSESTFGYRFIYNGEKISKWELKSLMKSEDSTSFQYFRKALRSSAWELATGLPGGALLGIELSDILAGNGINYARLTSSVALCAVSSYFYFRKERSYIQSVLSFNKYLQQKEPSVSIGFGATASGGLGLKLLISKPVRSFAH